MLRIFVVAVAILQGAIPAGAAENDWNTPHAPVRIYGNTYYVGTQGIAAVLLTSPSGHILIDGGTAEAAPLVADNIAALGFKIKDVKVILNTHAHFDHAGALSALQRMSGAAVKASAPSAPVLSTGKIATDDPQAGLHADMQPVANVTVIEDGEVVTVGSSQAKAVFTPGHTAGGTSWTWRACEGDRCLNIVFADSLTAVSADPFRFSDTKKNPNAVSDFEKSFKALSGAPCDILLTPHPAFSKFWQRVDERDSGRPDALIDPTACRRYVDVARAALDKRLASEKAQ